MLQREALFLTSKNKVNIDMREAYVSKKRVGNKEYGIIASLPADLIGKKVYILTEDEWREIQEKLLEYEKIKKTFELIKNMKVIDIMRVVVEHEIQQDILKEYIDKTKRIKLEK